MNYDLIIKTTNRIGFYAAAALIYWVFIFVTITIFDLKIFRERMTEMFLFSLLGIIAVMGGTMILNVMANLSKISSAISATQYQEEGSSRNSRWWLIAIVVSFPLIAALLFAGNMLSAHKKETMLISSAEKLVSENQDSLVSLAEYNFSTDYIGKTERILSVLEKVDKHFPEIMIIFPDTIDGRKLYLSFSGIRHSYSDEKRKEKVDYIFSTSSDEREYLENAFAKSSLARKFHADNGKYSLFFPTQISGKFVMLYFSDYQRYGKFGS